MNICFSFENLYPADSRAGRHIETLVRRFQERGHEVCVVTTPVDEPIEPDGIEVLRLREAPGAKGHARSDTLAGKAITKFLKQLDVQVHFAEGLTPLSAVVVKAAHRAGVKTITRVLADSDGVVHSIGADRKITPSALKKRISTMLGYSDAAAASSQHCADLLTEYFEGDTRIIEKCVDLNICNIDRVAPMDQETFREKFDLADRPAIIYAREDVRAETVVSTIPLVRALVAAKPELVLLVRGVIDDPEAAEKAIAEAGLQDAYRLCGDVPQRDLFAAYSIADVYLAPHDSRASDSELLEAMAMRTALACYAPKAASAPELIEKAGALVLPDDDPAGCAEALLGLLGDAPRLAELQDRAFAVAESMDIGVAVNRVQNLCEELLGLPPTDFDAFPDGVPPVDAEESEDVDEDDEDARDFGAGIPDEIDDDEDDDDDEDGRRRGGDDSADDEEEGDRREVAASGTAEERDDDDDEDDRAPRRRRRRRRGRRLRHEDEDGGEDGGDGEAEGEDDREPERSEDDMISEASVRLRELDPRLTLRDLMPFLRPPKNVLVMSMATSHGQHRAGEAVFEAFKATDQNLRVRQVNIADYLEPGHSQNEIDRTLREMFRDASLYGERFESDETRVDGSDDDPTSLFDSAVGAKLESMILDKRPHQVVLTHYLPLRCLARLKREHELRMRICVVVTAYDLHPFWMAEGVDHYLVPTEKVRFKMINAGVETSAVDVVGIPVHPRFEGEIERDRVRRENGLKANQPTILLRPGGIGTNEQVVETIERIIGSGQPMNLIVMAGKNDDLIKSVGSLDLPRGTTARAFGFVGNIHELMGASDLMITRAVGHTVAEAFASGLPMVLLKPAAGIEERTADWFVQRGVAMKAHDSVDLDWLITDLLRHNGRALRQMRDAAHNGGRPRSGSASLSVEKICRQLH